MAAKNENVRFYELVWPHRDAVLRTAQCLTHGAADAEDLAQETMIKAFRAINSLRDDSKVKPWLMTTLRHVRMDHLRARRDEVSLDQLEIEPERDDATSQGGIVDFSRDPEEVLNSFSDEEVIRALRDIPKEIRWTLLLVDVEGLDQGDAAQVLDVPVGTVKSRLHRGRGMLRASLASSEDKEPAAA